MWTAGQNVRMVDGSVHKFLGHTSVFGTPTVTPVWLLPVPTATALYWMYVSLTKAYVTDGTTHTNLTRQTAAVDVDYTAANAYDWTGGVLGGIPVLNNGADVPQMWLPVSTGQRLQALSAWDANWTCKVLRPFRNYLVALDVTKSGTRYPYMVKWSHSADPGAVPSSWDATSPTNTAGEAELKETPDFIVDSRTLRDVNIIYKEETTWGMQYVGPPYIFRFYRIFDHVGMFARHCAGEFHGRHFVVTQGDIVVHDGQQAKSIFPDEIGRKMSSALFNSIDTTYYLQSHVAVYPSRREVWFCYPESGSQYCTQALVWNWVTGTYSLRDLPSTTYATYGVADSSGAVSTIWDDDTDTWDSDSTVWDERLYNPAITNLVMASVTNTAIYVADNTNTFDGTAMTSYVERTAIHVPEEDGKPIPSNQTQYYLLRQLWPRMRSSGPVNFYIGGQATLNEGVDWIGPYAFDPTTDKYINIYVNTPLPAIRVESTTDIYWELDGLLVDLVPTSRY